MNRGLLRAAIVATAAMSTLSACGSSGVTAASAPPTSATVPATTSAARPTSVPTASLTPLPRSTKQFGLPVGTETKLSLVRYVDNKSTQIALAVSDAIWQPAGACKGTPVGTYLTLTIRETVISGPGAQIPTTTLSFVGSDGKKADAAPFSGCNHPALDSAMEPTNGLMVAQITYDVSGSHHGTFTYTLDVPVASWTIT